MEQGTTGKRPGGTTPRRAHVVVTHDCAIAFATAIARRWLREFFPRAPKAGHLPQKICRWLVAEERAPGKRLIARLGRRYLLVRRHQPTADETFVLLLEVAPTRAALSRGSGTLTRRESEVLGWVNTGKSDAEIAIIVACAVGTVNKHVQRILLKLGVENRMTAASYLRVMATNDIAHLGQKRAAGAGFERAAVVGAAALGNGGHRPPLQKRQ